MAQNECQQMEKTNFYQSLRNQISTLYNQMMALDRASEFLNTMDSTTATNMGMQAQVVTDVAELRAEIDALLVSYKAAGGLKDAINKLRYI